MEYVVFRQRGILMWRGENGVAVVERREWSGGGGRRSSYLAVATTHIYGD
jgi:hypothetical protein